MQSCEHCHIPFVTWPSEIKRGGGRFCCRYCWEQASKRPLEERFWAMVNKTDTCWLWTGANRGGQWPYGVIFTRWGESTKQAHRVSWEIHHGPVPEGMWVLHKCDVPQCVNPDHLFLGMATDNTEDMCVKNRCMTEKLTQEQVDDIRRRYSQGETMDALAKEFDIVNGTVWHVVHNRTWKVRRG